MRKGKTIAVCILVALALVAIITVAFFRQPTNLIYEENKSRRQVFGVLAFETLRLKQSPINEEVKENILANAQAALLYVGTSGNSTVPSPYDKLCRYSDKGNQASSSRCNVSFISFVRVFNTGYFWMQHSVERYGPGVCTFSGAWNVLTLVKLRHIDGRWVATALIEAP